MGLLGGETKGGHLLAVYILEQGLVFVQIAVEARENEIKRAPQLLAQLPLSGAIVLGNAMQTQLKLSKQII